MNLWHDIQYGESEDEVNTVIEIPKGSNMKYELEKETGNLMLDRAMHSAVYYPGNYGMIPQTYWDDGDPLDILIISDEPLYPKTITKVRPIGVMRMIDDGEGDDKILGVLEDDPRYDEVEDIEDVASHRVDKIKDFFETYKNLKEADVSIEAVDGREAAQEAVKKGIRLYKEKFD